MKSLALPRSLAWFAALLACALALSGCAVVQGPEPQPGASAVNADQTPPVMRSAQRHGQAGGVFMRDNNWSLTSDSPALRPGDVVTVQLNETTQASKKADTTFGKSSNVAIQPITIAGKALKTDIGISGSRDFNGAATSTQENTLQGAITVIVQEVLPNGLLRITGEKTLFLNQGEEFIRLSGYLRAADVNADNSVSSQRIANARIAYSGRGALNDSNTAGWLTRFFNSAWMPM